MNDFILSNTFRKNESGGAVMVRHMVCWNYKEGVTDKEREDNEKQIKSGLLNLKNLMDGVVSIEVVTDMLGTSMPDIMLNAVFVDEEALQRYQLHEEHIKVSRFIGSVTQNRYCIDYYEK